MKLAIATLLVGSAAAFAPAATTVRNTALNMAETATETKVRIVVICFKNEKKRFFVIANADENAKIYISRRYDIIYIQYNQHVHSIRYRYKNCEIIKTNNTYLMLKILNLGIC